MPDLVSLENQVALITGAASGFGRALAERLAPLGVLLVLGDLSETGGAQLANQLNAAFPSATTGQPRCVFQKTDVTTRDLHALFDLAQTQYGRLDIVVNNAGIGDSQAFHENTTDAWKPVLEIDLTAVIQGCRLALTSFLTHGRQGTILNVSSLAGLYPQPLQPVYAAAKAGVLHLTQSLAGYAPGVRAVAVCPGFAPTGITAAARATLGSEQYAAMTAGQEITVAAVVDAMMWALRDPAGVPGGAYIRITRQQGTEVFVGRQRLARL